MYRRLDITLAVSVAVGIQNCVYQVGRWLQSTDSDQCGGGNRATGVVIGLVHWKNGQVSLNTCSCNFSCKDKKMLSSVAKFGHFLFNWASTLGYFLYHLGIFDKQKVQL